MKAIVRYSEAFKLQVVREIENAKYASCHAAAEAYGIHGQTTVQRWVRHYGKACLLRKVVRVETTDERNELKRLKARVRELESALSDAHLDLRLERAYLDISCERAGDPDVVEFKKKHVGRLSIAPRQTASRP